MNQCIQHMACNMWHRRLQVSRSQCTLAELCVGAAEEPYILVQMDWTIEVVLANSISSTDLLKAFVHAHVLSQMQAPAGPQV